MTPPWLHSPFYWEQIHKWVHRLFMFNTLISCSHSVSITADWGLNAGLWDSGVSWEFSSKTKHFCRNPGFSAYFCSWASVCSHRENYCTHWNKTNAFFKPHRRYQQLSNLNNPNFKLRLRILFMLRWELTVQLCGKICLRVSVNEANWCRNYAGGSTRLIPTCRAAHGASSATFIIMLNTQEDSQTTKTTHPTACMQRFLYCRCTQR